MAWVVVKIGGSILKSARDYLRAAESLRRHYLSKGNRVITVVSAASGVTDLILEAFKGSREAREEAIHRILSIAGGVGGTSLESRISKVLEPLEKAGDGVGDPWVKARLLSIGEAASRMILVQSLRSLGVKALEIPAPELVRARGDPLNSRIDYRETSARLSAIAGRLEEYQAVVVDGFVAMGEEGVVVLGRGGSDYTATALAALSNATHVHLVTDVDGIYSADPAIVLKPRRVEALGYREASAAASYGVKKLHPRTFEPINTIRPVEVRIGAWTRWTRIAGVPEVKPPRVKLVASRRVDGVAHVSLIGSGLASPELVSEAVAAVRSAGLEFHEMILSPRNQSLAFKVDRSLEWALVNALHGLVGVY